MKRSQRLVLPALSLVLCCGCAHASHPVSSSGPSVKPLPYDQVIVASGPDPVLPVSPEASVESGSEKADDVSDSPVVPATPNIPAISDNTDLDYIGDEDVRGKAGIADPLEPFNRAMFRFNDKLYFWVLKPVAQGYGTIVPKPVRTGVKNFFSNIASPIRIVNCALQANFAGAARELGRFAVNTIWGIGGFLDLASDNALKLTKQDEDLGQTLGVYGFGQGFYIHWPIFGPSSPRDTVGMIGDLFLHPVTYLSDSGIATGLRTYEKVNAVSLSIGDYESLKDAAVDPYVSFRDAYVQYRWNKVRDRGSKAVPQPGPEN
jgi:phospholipid-binding lipoprotein MlaA